MEVLKVLIDRHKTTDYNNQMITIKNNLVLSANVKTVFKNLEEFLKLSFCKGKMNGVIRQLLRMKTILK